MSDPHDPHARAGAVRSLADGVEDHLEPLTSLDPLQIRTCDDLVRAMSKTALSGRALGEAADVLTAVARDPDCVIVATFSGAMTVAKMATVIVRMLEAGMIHAIVSTGALMAHGLSEAVGLVHHKAKPGVPDVATPPDFDPWKHAVHLVARDRPAQHAREPPRPPHVPAPQRLLDPLDGLAFSLWGRIHRRHQQILLARWRQLRDAASAARTCGGRSGSASLGARAQLGLRAPPAGEDGALRARPRRDACSPRAARAAMGAPPAPAALLLRFAPPG
jgi:hypothetical protein